MRLSVRRIALAVTLAGTAPVLAGEQPMDLRPPGMAEPAPAAGPAIVAKKRIARAVPLPRPRPGTGPAEEAAATENAAARPLAGAEDDAAVDRSLQTGAIAVAESQPAAPVPVAVPEPWREIPGSEVSRLPSTTLRNSSIGVTPGSGSGVTQCLPSRVSQNSEPSSAVTRSPGARTRTRPAGGYSRIA